MQIKKTLLASAALGLLFAPAAFAVDSLRDNDTIYGRTIDSIEATLAEYGINAQHVETWGTALRVDAVSADGSNYTVFVDRDSLQPLKDANGVATKTDLNTAPTASGWTISNAVSNPVSMND